MRFIYLWTVGHQGGVGGSQPTPPPVVGKGIDTTTGSG